MPRESKILKGDPNTVKHYECFGWELLSYNDGDIVLTRETLNPNYKQLVEYQKEYEAKLSQYKNFTYNKQSHVEMNILKFIILLFLFIIPGINYKNSIDKKNEEIDNINSENERRKKQLEIDTKDILVKSRNLFFGFEDK